MNVQGQKPLYGHPYSVEHTCGQDEDEPPQPDGDVESVPTALQHGYNRFHNHCRRLHHMSATRMYCLCTYDREAAQSEKKISVLVTTRLSC